MTCPHNVEVGPCSTGYVRCLACEESIPERVPGESLVFRVPEGHAWVPITFRPVRVPWWRRALRWLRRWA